MRFFRRQEKQDVEYHERQNCDGSKFVDPKTVMHPSQDGKSFANVDSIKVVYDGRPGGFSLAIGIWTDESCGISSSEMLLMRWNGLGDEQRGFPASTHAGQWFPIPPLFAEDILSRLRDRLNENHLETMVSKYGFSFET